MTNASPRADLVMEGGGVKGMAFVGALDVLARAQYRFPRIAGTSAGAIMGSLVAALQHAGEPLTRLPDIAATLDLPRVTDSSAVGRALGPLHGIADAVSLLATGGLHEGKYLRDWLTGVLGDLGVATFGDLRRTDPGSALPPEREYALVVVVSDLSDQRMSLLPWDYGHYGLDPDEQSVADAVGASAAVPYVFRPVRLKTRPEGSASLVDGGLLSNYPITVFDHEDRADARWPTIGIRLSAREHDPAVHAPVGNLLQATSALVETAVHGIDRRHIDDPDAIERTMFVDTSGLSALDFDQSPAQIARLVEAGRTAATKHLAGLAPDDDGAGRPPPH